MIHKPMTVKELKDYLADKADDMHVALVPDYKIELQEPSKPDEGAAPVAEPVA